MTVHEFGTQNKDIVMLLHGGGLSWWNYREEVRALAEMYHVIVPVLDGHADSDAGFTTIEDAAARLIDCIDTCFGGQITALCGLSLGGQLSQRSHICCYALIESALVKPMMLTRRLIAPSIAMSYGLIQQKWFAKMQAAYLGIPKSLFEEYYRDTCKISKADMTAFLKANCAYSIKPSLSHTAARVRILAGAREQKAILDSARLLHQTIPGSSMEILRGLRHGDLSINQPERYIRILRDWMEKG